MPGPAQHPFSDAPWLLNPGDSVRIHNFTARPELNDLIGKVVSYEKAKGRFAVEVPGLPNVMLFKLANLQLSNAPTPPTRAPVVDACPQTNDALAAFSENPGISYTQSTWEAQLVDVAAEVLEGAPIIDEMDDPDLAQALAPSMLSELETTHLPLLATSMLPSVSDLPEATLHILKMILSNVIKEPEELKYRSLSQTNKALSQKLFPHQDAVAFLCACGFEESNEGVHLPDGADLKLVEEALNSVRTALEPAGKPPPPPPSAAAAAKSPTTPRPTHPESGATHTIDEEEERRRRQEQRAPLVGKQVQGLEAKPELNNRTGTATAWDGERGRYTVRLEDAGWDHGGVQAR